MSAPPDLGHVPEVGKGYVSSRNLKKQAKSLLKTHKKKDPSSAKLAFAARIPLIRGRRPLRLFEGHLPNLLKRLHRAVAA